MSLFFSIMGIGKTNVDVVTITAASITTFQDVSAPSLAGILINADGTIDKRVNASVSQINASTDWVIPVGSAPGDYEVRVTSVVGSSFSVAAAVEDTWVAITSNREWRVTDSTGGGADNRSVTFDLEIRKGSTGAAIATAEITLSAAAS